MMFLLPGNISGILVRPKKTLKLGSKYNACFECDVKYCTGIGLDADEKMTCALSSTSPSLMLVGSDSTVGLLEMWRGCNAS